jgi:hypothetical protein
MRNPLGTTKRSGRRIGAFKKHTRITQADSSEDRFPSSPSRFTILRK